MAALRPAPHHDLTYEYGDDSDGCTTVRIGLTALPCPGVALRFNAVIDCTPGEDRMPPVTIDFVNKNQPPAVAAGEITPQSDGIRRDDAAPPTAGGQAQVPGRFTCDSGDFILFSQLRRVEEMVAAAGLPPECAPSVEAFCSLSARSVTNTFWKAVAITVVAGAPGSLLVDDEDEEVVPAGAAIEECAICYKIYVVGGATSMKLPCSHTYHRKCLERWTSVNRSCPYCRGPVPHEHEYLDEEDEDIFGEEADPSPLPDAETPSPDVSGSQPRSTWRRICCITAGLLGIASLLARRFAL